MLEELFDIYLPILMETTIIQEVFLLIIEMI